MLRVKMKYSIRGWSDILEKGRVGWRDFIFSDIQCRWLWVQSSEHVNGFADLSILIRHFSSVKFKSRGVLYISQRDPDQVSIKIN